MTTQASLLKQLFNDILILGYGDAASVLPAAHAHINEWLHILQTARDRPVGRQVAARAGCARACRMKTAGNPDYFDSNLIANCTQPDTDRPFDEVSGR